MCTNHSEDQIKSWLTTVLKKENLSGLSIKIEGVAGKGDGTTSDIIFVEASGKTDNNQNETIYLAMKCSKQSQALRESVPSRDIFLNEIHIYEKVLSYFTNFQLEKGIKAPFASFPKCYGAIVGEDYEILVLENLKAQGYSLWPKSEPLTRKHLSLVLGEYAKYHALSLGVKTQRPEEYDKLANTLSDIYEKQDISVTVFTNSIEEVIQLLQSDLEEFEITRLKNFKTQVRYIFTDMLNCADNTKVLIHGDSWSNNLMFKHQEDNKNCPSHVAILDWQLSKSTSPICDLSYFLFASIAEEDLCNINTLLKEYYKNLNVFLKQLGSDLDTIYPIERFFKDWNKMSKYGVLFITLVLKICLTQEDEVFDVAQDANAGKDIAKTFQYQIKDESNLKKRLKPIIKYAIANDLI